MDGIPNRRVGRQTTSSSKEAFIDIISSVSSPKTAVRAVFIFTPKMLNGIDLLPNKKKRNADIEF